MRVRDIAKHFDNRRQSRLTHLRTNGACFARSSILLEGLLSFIIWPGGGLMISIRCLWEPFTHVISRQLSGRDSATFAAIACATTLAAARSCDLSKAP
jgi:hypothetical protein